MPAKWLFKTEPSEYSYERLVAEKKARWDGVTNALALSHLRKVRTGDEILIYHTADVRAVVGVAKAVSDSYPDPAAGDPKRAVVDIAPVRAVARPVTLAEIKANKKFKDFELVRIGRLSVMPVADAIWSEILEMSRSGSRS